MMRPIKISAKVAQKQQKQIFIHTDFIRLDAALKLCDAVQTGGHGKNCARATILNLST